MEKKRNIYTVYQENLFINILFIYKRDEGAWRSQREVGKARHYKMLADNTARKNHRVGNPQNMETGLGAS